MSSAMGFPGLAVALWCQASPELDWSGFFFVRVEQEQILY